jgi:hypothetical protein
MKLCLDDIYAQDNTAQRYENYLAMYCPWHGGNRRSLMCYEDDFFICLSCGEAGKLKKLFDKLSRGIIILPKEIQEERNFSNPWTSWLREESLFDVCKNAHQTLRNYPDLRYYLKKRGIPDEEILGLHLGYRESYYIFPCINPAGRIVGAVARASDSIETTNKYITPNRKIQENSKLLYVPSWERIQKSSVVYLAFGIISAISLYLLGLPVASTLTGKKAKPELFQDIRKKIVIVPDYLEEPSAITLANSLGWRGNVLRLPYHDQLLDPNDLFLHEPETLKGLL